MACIELTEVPDNLCWDCQGAVFEINLRQARVFSGVLYGLIPLIALTCQGGWASVKIKDDCVQFGCYAGQTEAEYDLTGLYCAVSLVLQLCLRQTVVVYAAVSLLYLGVCDCVLAVQMNSVTLTLYHEPGCLELCYCNMAEWFWWDSSLISTTNWFPSMIWHCWFGHPACKNYPRNDR